MKISVRGMAPLLQVFDMPASLRFYRDILGFEVVESSGGGDEADWVLLQLADIQMMLNTAYEKPDRPAKPDPMRVNAHSDTALYFGCPDVDAAYEYLRDKFLKLHGPEVAPYGMKQLYVTDPDGYNVCFQWPAKAETEKSRTVCA